MKALIVALIAVGTVLATEEPEIREIRQDSRLL